MKSLTVLITGASGLVGQAVAATLEESGATVLRLGRRAVGPRSFQWNIATSTVSLPPEDGLDQQINMVLHFAAENIANGRWTPSRKEAIRESRIKGTTLLAETFARRAILPTLFLSASAVGIYGDRGAENLTEESAPGHGFLADLCQEWERAVEPLQQRGVRCVKARFGVVLAKNGGALEKMLPPFRLGLGGPLGDGSQYISWITINDLCRAVLFLIDHPTANGPFNITSPTPVTNRDFARALAHAVHRPSLISVPRFAARLAVGDLADEALFASQRAVPRRLLEEGFVFEDPEINSALAGLDL